MLDMNLMPTVETRQYRRTRSNTVNFSSTTPSASSATRPQSTPKQRPTSEDGSIVENWDDMLLTPENFLNSVQPLSPPKKKEAPTNLQDFLLKNHSVYSVSSPQLTIPKTSSPTVPSPPKSTRANSTTSPPKNANPEERFAGAAFFNSPAPNNLPLPTFDDSTVSASSVPQRAASAPKMRSASNSNQTEAISLRSSANIPRNDHKSEPRVSFNMNQESSNEQPRRSSPQNRARSASGNQPQPSPKKRSYVRKGKSQSDLATSPTTTPAPSQAPVQSPQPFITPQAGDARSQNSPVMSFPQESVNPQLEHMSFQLKQMLNIA